MHADAKRSEWKGKQRGEITQSDIYVAGWGESLFCLSTWSLNQCRWSLRVPVQLTKAKRVQILRYYRDEHQGSEMALRLASVANSDVCRGQVGKSAVDLWEHVSSREWWRLWQTQRHIYYCFCWLLAAVARSSDIYWCCFFFFSNEAGNLILMSHLPAFRKLSTGFFWHRTNKIYLWASLQFPLWTLMARC